MTQREMALFYEGLLYALSNFSAFSVLWRGRWWMTAEHAYQAAKFTDINVIMAIMLAPSAHEAKQIAKEHAHLKRADWNEVKIPVMEEILRAKLSQHAYVRETLEKTGKIMIVENSPTDSFWGRGPDWKGQNHLGKIWMRLRREMRISVKTG